MLTSLVRFTAISLLLACNGKLDSSPEEGPRILRGTAVQHHSTDKGIVDQPRDLSAVTFRAHPTSTLQAGSQAVTGAADGSFEVSLGSGAVEWLEIGVGGDRVFVPGGASTPDLGVYRFGRGDIQLPAASTPVVFEISGLSAWQGGDALQIVSPNTGMTLAGPENELASYPRAGATSITGQALDWKVAFAPIVDAGRGDTTWALQMAAADHHSALARAGVARDFTVRDGRSTTLAVTLAPVAQDTKLALHWKGSQFAALAAEAGPGAQPAAAPALSIKTLPDVMAHHNDFFRSFYAGLPSLVDFGPISGTTDLDETVAYGNPFAAAGATWTEFVAVAYAGSVPIPTPQGIGSLPAMMVAAIPVSAIADGADIAPPISPVRAVTLDGTPLDAPRLGAGASPTIAWDAPAVGTATSYAVTVHAVETSTSGVSTAKIATLHTRATSVRIPNAMLPRTGSYVLTITAISAEGADLTSRPFVGALPYASADYVTARITP